MRITSFNVNKFCGAYSNGNYFNPKNIDFKTPIKRMIDTLLETNEDVVFLQEVTDNKFVELEKLFPNDKYKIQIENRNCKVIQNVFLKEEKDEEQLYFLKLFTCG